MCDLRRECDGDECRDRKVFNDFPSMRTRGCPSFLCEINEEEVGHPNPRCSSFGIAVLSTLPSPGREVVGDDDFPFSMFHFPFSPGKTPYLDYTVHRYIGTYIGGASCHDMHPRHEPLAHPCRTLYCIHIYHSTGTGHPQIGAPSSPFRGTSFASLVGRNRSSFRSWKSFKMRHDRPAPHPPPLQLL